jgi:glycosyltransferase involved in cell wall biosynthesis
VRLRSADSSIARPRSMPAMNGRTVSTVPSGPRRSSPQNIIMSIKCGPRKTKVILAVPLPPPLAGTEIINQAMLGSFLKDEFDLLVLRTSVHKANAERGKVTAASLGKLVLILARLFFKIIAYRPACVYTMINQNRTGFVRDSLIILVSKILGRRIILHFHGSNFEAFFQQQKIFFRWYILFILRRADRIILQAHWVREKFAQWVDRDKLRVIYSPIEAREYEPLFHERSAHREEINVLFLNHLSVAKGTAALLDAARLLVRENGSVKFLIVGDIIPLERNILIGEWGERIHFVDIPKAIEDIRNDSELKDRIVFTGEIRDARTKKQLLRDADIFVLPSYSEGCPLSVLEAMASGLPVIVTPVGALVEIIKDGENGFLVPTGRSDKLKEKIDTLARDPRLRRSMGEKNLLLVKSTLNTDVILRQIADVFHEMCGD